MDALELLKQDHQKVKQLFERGQGTEDKKQQKQIFKEIKSELETHARIEETIFYPAMQEHEELKDMVLESLEEHKQMKTVLREMSRVSPSSERFKPMFKLLKDDVEHHAVEEEEQKMFPKIRKLIRTRCGETQTNSQSELKRTKSPRRIGTSRASPSGQRGIGACVRVAIGILLSFVIFYPPRVVIHDAAQGTEVQHRSAPSSIGQFRQNRILTLRIFGRAKQYSCENSCSPVAYSLLY